MAELSVPTGNDFFEIESSNKSRQGSEQGLKQPFFTKRMPRSSNIGAYKLDSKNFDQRLVDRAFEAISEL